MRHRPRIVRASCPDLLIDTDDWAMPDLATFREYRDVQAELGIPALYLASHIDTTLEPLEESDYRAIRDLWSRFG
jgi:hypothetical protein